MSTRVAVDYFADLSCPWCYVGWVGLKRAAAQERGRVSVNVAWRTFFLTLDMPREGYDRESYLSQRFAPAQLEAANAALRAAAAAVDAPFAIEKAARIPNTLDAHRVVHWAAEQGRAEGVIDALFRAHFAEGEDIGQHAVLVAAAEGEGLDPQEIAERLGTDQDVQLMRDLHAAAVRIGVQGVPVAVFNKRAAVMGAQGVDAYVTALARAA